MVSDSQIFTMAVGDVDTDSIALLGDGGDGTTDGGQTGGTGTTGAVTGGATGGGSTSGGTSPNGGLAQTGAGVALPLGASGAALLVVGAGTAVSLHRRKRQSTTADGTDLPAASS